MLPDLPPAGKLLSFAEVAKLDQFRGMNRAQVGRHLLRLDAELKGQLLAKTAGRSGKVHYRVTLANLRRLVPVVFGILEDKPKESDLEDRVRVLEEAVQRQAFKLGEHRNCIVQLQARLAELEKPKPQGWD